jgi:hypothetical protein
MYYRCIRFNTNQERNQVRDTILLEQKELSVLKNGVPDSVRCTRPYNSKPATLANSRAHSIIIHRTVWCATGLSGEPMEQRLSSANGRLQKRPPRWTVRDRVRAAKSEGTGLSGVAPDCLVPQEDKVSNGQLAPNPNGWLTWWRTRQRIVPVRWRTGLSGAPIASSLGQWLPSSWRL